MGSRRLGFQGLSRMRAAFLGVLAALSLGGAAIASDYVVVNSTDPAIKRGTALNAGQRVPLAAGATLVVMRASGEVTTLRGGASGAVTPGVRLAAADTARFESLKALVQPPAEGRTFGARRGGLCPPAETLTAMEDILRVADQGGCKRIANEALDALVAKSAQ
jgi:hypothetical protein